MGRKYCDDCGEALGDEARAEVVAKHLATDEFGMWVVVYSENGRVQEQFWCHDDAIAYLKKLHHPEDFHIEKPQERGIIHASCYDESKHVLA